MGNLRRCKDCELRESRPLRFWCPVFKIRIGPGSERKNCKQWVGREQKRAPPDAKRGDMGGG